MQYAPFLDRLELRIDALDDGFYLDTQEASAHYHADFLQDRFLQDLIFLYEKAAEKFIRIQHFELRTKSDRITQSITTLCCFR